METLCKTKHKLDRPVSVICKDLYPPAGAGAMQMPQACRLCVQATLALPAGPGDREGATVACAVALAARVLQGLPDMRSPCGTEARCSGASAELAALLTAETKLCLEGRSPALASI